MLKSLQLAGFKSFADKTRLVFPEGVTAVVGPNGSGKSNVVDSVKWVLGSQSPRSLRGKEMTDVIFNGSESRGPVGAAEATLVFDNTPPAGGGRRLFELDEPEIRLTRRVHRSGEGEYLVNGQVCRLKDFRQLLAGTGLGSDSYSIIEQGRVDAALRASPLERRLLLEEAAGISRFRLKKREAAKRLERVEQNLLRLSDIVDEVEGRLRRVRAQAGKARKYREATRRLKEARTELATIDWRRLSTERSRLDAEHATLDERLAAARAAIAEGEARLESLAKPDPADEQAARTLHDARQRLSRNERARATVEVELAQAEAESTRARDGLLAARLAAAEAGPDDETRRALAAAEQAAEDYHAQQVTAEQRVVELRGTLDKLRRREAERASRDRRVATLQGRITARFDEARAATQAASAELRRLAARAGESQRGVLDAMSELAQASTSRDASADRLLGIDTRVAESQRAVAQSREELSRLQRRAADEREALAGQRHRLEWLLEEQRRLERLNADVHGLVQRSAPGAPLQVYGLVADLIHVDEDFVPLIEAALGPRAEHVVVDSRAALLAGLASPDAGLSVRASFESLEATPSTAIDQIDLSGAPGVVGKATDFVEVEPRFATLARRLFGRVWFVQSLADATRILEGIGRGLTFVTLAGEVLSSDGSVTAGSGEGAPRLLTRRQDVTNLQTRIAQGEQALAEASTAIQACEDRMAEHEARIASLHQDAVEERERLATAAQHAATLDERRRNQETERSRLAGRAAQIQQTVTGGGRRIATLTNRLGLVSRSTEQQSEDPNGPAAADRLRAAESSLAAETARLKELRAVATRHAGLVETMRREAAATGVADDLAERLRSAETEATATADRREELLARALNTSDAFNAARIASERAEQRETQARVARQAAEQVRGEVVTAVTETRAEADEIARRVGELELSRQRVDLERSAVAQRVRDDYGVDVTTLPDPAPEAPAPNPAELRTEIDHLNREVKSVSSVNLESLDELDDLETRFEELSSQYQDLSDAKKSLSRLTSRINSDSRELFLATYETVRGHFRELFSRLFGGGEADLILVEPEGEANDPLEAGIEIVASPPGKEMRNLSLMSGGEKTMTAVALLLALFRSRPSPFCLLDEVDAALDEANIGRFLDVLKDFLGSTQFIVISHSKRTMAGADTMYGITMQESGVSKQVSVRLEDVGEDGRIRLTRSGGDPPAQRAA